MLFQNLLSCKMERRVLIAYFSTMLDGRLFRFTKRMIKPMWLRMKKSGLWIPLICCLILAAVVPSYSRGHGEVKGHWEIANEKAGGIGGEVSGQIAGWLFSIANFPVVASILLKTCGRVLPQNWNLKEDIEKINQQQKRRLMKLHYWLNPVAVAAAFIHLLSTKCEATALPEFGLGVMILICILGLIVTFKVSPAFMRKAVFKFHTSPILLAAGVFTLIIGHSMVG
jgi:hypothetical protein